jgi:hypothetical protein
MKMCFLIFLPIAVSGSAWAQPLSQVQQFLQLSDSQLQTILTNNDDYNRWSGDKQNRIRQVQTEIADETRKSPLDPNALGIRYAEIETICREMKDRANESRTQNISVLNPGPEVQTENPRRRSEVSPGHFRRTVRQSNWRINFCALRLHKQFDWVRRVAKRWSGPANGFSLPPIPTAAYRARGVTASGRLKIE